MASIRKRNGKWQVQVRRKGRRSVTKSFEQRADAQRWAHRIEVTLDARDVGHESRVLGSLTLAQLIDRYLLEVVPHKRGANVEAYILRAFQRRWLAKLPLSELNRYAVVRYRDERLAAVKAATVYRELGIIRHCLNIARVEWGLPIDQNPLADISLPAIGAHRNRRLSEFEERRLLDAAQECRNPLIVPLIVVALETAMRQGELLRARWSELDEVRGELKIPITKNGYSRSIPLTNRALATFLTLPSKEPRLFPTTASAVQQAWRRCVRRAGISDLRFHDLRHEAVSRFIEMGLTIPEVGAISGHRDHRVLLRYAHPNAALLREKLQSAEQRKPMCCDIGPYGTVASAPR